MNTQIPLEVVAVALWLLFAIGLTHLTPNGITDARFTKEDDNVSSNTTDN